MAKTSAPAMRKVYVTGSRPDIRVPMREVILTPPNAPVRLYDTSGPYTDPAFQADPRKGLPPLRLSWNPGPWRRRGTAPAHLCVPPRA